ncbi:MAG TPA: hypothetical protein HA364_08980, partial [Thermoplasmata archaeon]|nr:hypothetical protein [Thermoplasmata archaeon]
SADPSDDVWKKSMPESPGYDTSEYSDAKLSASVSIDVLSPAAMEKLATMNIVHRAIPQLVDRARLLNLNSGRERISNGAKMA